MTIAPASGGATALLGLLVLLGGCARTPCPEAPRTTDRERQEHRVVARPRDVAPTSVDEVAAQVIGLMSARDGKGIFSLFNQRMRQAVSESKTRRIAADVATRKGRILSSRRVGPREGRRGTYRLRAARGDWLLVVALDSSGAIEELRVSSVAQVLPVARSDIHLSLPFRGQWFVAWGGNREDANKHVSVDDQRRAADLVIVDEKDKTHTGDGTKNSDYFAYGKEVLAVADGTVTTVVDGVPENAPGTMNRYVAPGNFVIVKHTEKLYSLYAHLQPGSMRVSVGVKVKEGDVLGLCGNSGNSSEPHLHFQLQDGPGQSGSYGVEPIFRDVEVIRDGQQKKIQDYTWLRGDHVNADAK